MNICYMPGTMVALRKEQSIWCVLCLHEAVVLDQRAALNTVMTAGVSAEL